MSVIDRRRLLALILASVMAASPAATALAKDGGPSGGDSGGHGGDDGGGDRNGGDDRGGDNSGRDGDDNGDRGHGKNDDNGDDGPGKNDDDGVDDQKRATQAQRDGKVHKLRDILRTVRHKYSGEVLDVNLRKAGATYVYRVKMMDRSGRVFTVRIDAVDRRILGVGGN